MNLAESIKKAEGAFQQLRKNAETQRLLDGIDESGLSPEWCKAFRKQLFTDKSVPEVGNKLAYDDFIHQGPPAGVHIRINGNDFGGINGDLGHEHGNKAVSHLGRAVRDSMDSVLPSATDGLHNAWRLGGDEFHAHLPDMAAAARFAHGLRSRLEAIPPLNGEHALSVSMGFGSHQDQAHRAMLLAKGAKRDANYRPGFAQTHAHSMVPGHEGPVPVQDRRP